MYSLSKKRKHEIAFPANPLRKDSIFIKKKNFRYHPRNYVHKRHLTFPYHCFQDKIWYGVIGKRYVPVLQKSLEYLDLYMHTCTKTLRNVSSTRGIISECNERVLDAVGVDWDARMDKKFVFAALKSHRRIWMYFQSLRFWMILLRIAERVVAADDYHLALLKYIRPLNLSFELLRVKVPAAKVEMSTALVFFLGLLLRHSDDSQSVANLLKVFSDTDVGWRIFRDHEPDMMRRVLYHSQKAGFNLWGILPSATDEDRTEIQRFYLYDGLEDIRTFIRFGGSIEKAIFSPGRCSEYAAYIYFGGVYDVNGGEDDPLKEYWFGWKGLCRRDTLLNQIVHFARKKYKDKRSNDAESAIKLIWESIPDVYPTGSEIFGGMEAIFVNRNKLIPDNLNWAVDYVRDFFYKSVTEGEVVDFHRPRSLRDLSRCVIRKQLCISRNLPEGIYSLKIPEVLKKFLNLGRC